MLKLTNKIRKRILGNKSLLFFIFLLVLVVCLFLIYYFYKKTTHIEGIDIKSPYVHFLTRKDGDAIDIQVNEVDERLYITYVSYGSNKEHPTKNSTANGNNKYVDIFNNYIGSTTRRYYLSEFKSFDILGDPERGKVKYLYIEYIGIPFVNDPTFTPKLITVSDGNKLNINVDNNYVIKITDASVYKGNEKYYNNRNFGDIKDQIQIKIGYKSSFSNDINISDLIGNKLNGFKLSITYTQVKKINDQTTQFLKDSGINKYESFFYKNINNRNYVKLGSYYQQEIGIDDGIFQKYPIGVNQIKDPSKPFDIAKRIASAYNSVIYGIYNYDVVAYTQTIPQKLYNNINNKQICGNNMGCVNDKNNAKSIITFYIDINSNEYKIIDKLGKADKSNFDKMIGKINNNDDAVVNERDGYASYTFNSRVNDNPKESMSFYFIKKTGSNYIFLPIISATVSKNGNDVVGVNVRPKIEDSIFYKENSYGVYYSNKGNKLLNIGTLDNTKTIRDTNKGDLFITNVIYRNFYECFKYFIQYSSDSLFCTYDIPNNTIKCYMLNAHKSYIDIILNNRDNLYNYFNIPGNEQKSILNYLSDNMSDNTKEVKVFSGDKTCNIILKYSYILMQFSHLGINKEIQYNCIALDTYGGV
jgi:hypothetical protein